VLASTHALAATYQIQGLWEKAEELQVKSVDQCLKSLGEEHFNNLMAMNGLGSNFHSQGRWNDAEKLHARLRE
jgi:Tetratricopeptide repeat